MKINIFKNNQGFSLIETIGALTILTIVTGALFSFYVQSLSLQNLVSNRYIATFLMNDGIEQVKNIADNSIVAGSDFDGVIFINAQDKATALSGAITPANVFTRTVTVDNLIASERFKVSSEVTWSGRGGSLNKVKSIYFIYNTNLHD